MKKLINFCIVIFLGLILLNSCKKEDEYNWGNYKPELLGVTGNTTVVANTNLTYVYAIDGIRAGSTYTWEVIQAATSVAIAPQTGIDYYKATLSILKESTVQVTAKITVFETTAVGVVCDKDTLSIIVSPYVAVNLDAFCGNYIETDNAGTSGTFTCPVTITRDPDDQYFGLIIHGILNTSWWWGAPGGTLKIKLYGVDNTVRFDKQEIGITDPTYGAVSMSLKTAGVWGSFNLTNHSFTYQGNVTVSAGSFGKETFTYTVAP